MPVPRLASARHPDDRRRGGISGSVDKMSRLSEEKRPVVPVGTPWTGPPYLLVCWPSIRPGTYPDLEKVHAGPALSSAKKEQQDISGLVGEEKF